MPHKRTAHSSFSHDSIDALGYDWERIANPELAPKYPFKVYFPRTTDDVVTAVKEAVQLGHRLTVRSSGHSSNDLVLADGGAILSTQRLAGVLELDPAAPSVVVQSGVVLAELDRYLKDHGLGLPVIGDHDAISAGGFASVGGISPASHRQGMFIDNVIELEYVAFDGQIATASRARAPELLDRLLAGTGQFGIITKLKLRLLRVDKFATVLDRDRRLFTDLHAFLADTERRIRHPGDAVMECGLWNDLRLGTRALAFGQFSQYHTTPQRLIKRLRNALGYGYLHGLGWCNGMLPLRVELLIKYLGIAGILFSPRYATIKDVETFTDRTLDESVGDPSRMLIALVPADRYTQLFRALYQVCLGVRARTGALTTISIYVKAITSPYLTRASTAERHCELMLYLGLDAERMTAAVLDDMVSEIDDLCIAHGAFRYMHSKTVKDPRRQRIDPNAVHAARDPRSASATATAAIDAGAGSAAIARAGKQP